MKSIKSILLIDDDYVSTYLIEISLKSEKLTEKIEIASNGEEGLMKFKKLYEDKDAPEVILLDINMPVMDGFGFLKEFASLGIKNKPEIIILTSSVNPRDIERVQEFNIAGYLNKPFSPEDLKNIIKERNN